MKQLIIYEDKETLRHEYGLQISDQYAIEEKQGKFAVILVPNTSHVLPREKVIRLVTELNHWLNTA